MTVIYVYHLPRPRPLPLMFDLLKFCIIPSIFMFISYFFILFLPGKFVLFLCTFITLFLSVTPFKFNARYTPYYVWNDIYAHPLG